MLAVAVELATVPAKAEDETTWSAPVSDDMLRVRTVPRGMFVAARETGTATPLLIVTSGIVKLPVGTAGTATPLMDTIVTIGTADGSGELKSGPNVGVGVTVPVKVFVVESMRIQPFPPFELYPRDTPRVCPPTA
jgi:hypothetical protein